MIRPDRNKHPIRRETEQQFRFIRTEHLSDIFSLEEANLGGETDEEKACLTTSNIKKDNREIGNIMNQGDFSRIHCSSGNSERVKREHALVPLASPSKLYRRPAP